MKTAVLFDPPTYPRGVVSLSLPAVAACLRPAFRVRLIDLNLYSTAQHRRLLEDAGEMDLCGLRVSAQNLPYAAAFSRLVRELRPKAKIVWGGELPSLKPEDCLAHADCVVRGRFEPAAAAFLEDFAQGGLRRIYEGAAELSPGQARIPALELVENPGAYLRFMGQPFESSLGCTQSCTFCMVHVMQKELGFKPLEAMLADLRANPREFVNVVDYNLGNDKKHLLSVAEAIKRSGASGWMGEMCVESLDDDETLEALAESRCKIIYCGLESVSSGSLKAVAKNQNVVADYARIIRKAQRRGIEIASGFILGLPGTTEASFSDFLDFCEETGILYLKLTYLTFNPGTKVQASMAAKGRYLSEDLSLYDGNHLTFLPEGVSADTVFAGARRLIGRFYSPASLRRRSRHRSREPLKRAEFALMSWCYGRVYRQWLEHGLARAGEDGLARLLREPLRKSFLLRRAEELLAWVRSAGLRRRGRGAAVPRVDEAKSAL